MKLFCPRQQTEFYLFVELLYLNQLPTPGRIPTLISHYTVGENITATIKAKLFLVSFKNGLFPLLRQQYQTFLYCSKLNYGFSNFAISKVVALNLCFNFCTSFVDWFIASFLYCFPYSYRSSNYCNSYRSSNYCNSYRSSNFAIAKVVALNLIASIFV